MKTTIPARAVSNHSPAEDRAYAELLDRLTLYLANCHRHGMPLRQARRAVLYSLSLAVELDDHDGASNDNGDGEGAVS